MKRLCVSILLFLLCIGAPPALAQIGPNASSDEPLEITADESLEWQRANRLFVARKNAVAKQGDASVAAQKLTAHYRESETQDMEIYKLIAERDVQISSAGSVAYGDHAIYNLDEGLAVLTGQDLRMVSPEQTIIAQERFEYHVPEGRVVAVGRPKVIRPKPKGSGEDTLQSDELVALLKDNAEGKRVVDTIEAKGDVVIVTPTEIVTGAYGIYRAATNKAELNGGVTITRGPNVLEGERAVVDLTTNVSQMFGSQLPGGRVRGVFYSGSEDKAADKKPREEQERFMPPAADEDKSAVGVMPLLSDDDSSPPAPQTIEPEAGGSAPAGRWAPLTRP